MALAGFDFVPGTFDDDDAFAQLAETLEKLDAERGAGGLPRYTWRSRQILPGGV